MERFWLNLLCDRSIGMCPYLSLSVSSTLLSYSLERARGEVQKRELSKDKLMIEDLSGKNLF